MTEEVKKTEAKKAEPGANKLILSTKKSIHPPLEIVIDDVTYQNNTFSRALFEELKKHEAAALAGDIEALYQQVHLLYSVPMETLNSLDVRDIKSLLDFTMAKVFSTPEGPKTEAEEEEKKA